MTTDATIEKAKAVIEEMRELLVKLEAEKATKRNWPERIEAGMVFRSPGTTATWMATDVDGLFVCLKGETDSFKAAGRMMRLERDNVPHAGHARDILAIRTDAHEPTGAELVGKMCEFSDDDFVSYTTRESECHGTGVRGYMTKLGIWWKFARLAR